MRNGASRPVTLLLHAVTLACAGGKPVAHPLHRYITYEKWGFSTRYTPATCRYTGAARGGGGRANGYFATVIDRRYKGKPAANRESPRRKEICPAPFSQPGAIHEVPSPEDVCQACDSLIQRQDPKRLQPPRRAQS